MQPTPAFGFDQIASELIRDVLEVVAQKPGLPPARQEAIERTVACTIMAHNPRDPVETVLAGQCVVYDHVLLDGARDLLRGNAEEGKVKARPGVIAAGKMFLATLDALEKRQARPVDQLTFAREPAPSDEAAATAEMTKEVAQTAPPPARPAKPVSAKRAIAPPPTPPAEPDIPAVPDTDHRSEPGWSGFADAPPICFDKIEEVVLTGMTPEDRRLIRETLALSSADETDEQAAARLLGLRARLAARADNQRQGAETPAQVLEDAGADRG